MDALRALFDLNTIPEPMSGCLLWLGSASDRGYGRIKFKGKNLMATHLALLLAGREVPSGMMACHHCDNPACVNEAHLFIGTQFDNMRDMTRKGRHRPRGRPTALGNFCVRGHELVGDNVSGSGRMCVTCHRDRNRIMMRNKRAAERSSQLER